jgi:blue copper oxidase
MPMNRRHWLAALGGGAAAAAAGLWWRRKSEMDMTSSLPPSAGAIDPAAGTSRAAGLMELVDASLPFNVTARAVTHQFGDAAAVPMLAYEVEQNGRTCRNPILHVRSDAAMQARFWNQLDETSIIHWHGLRVDANNDGNPHYAVQPGEIYEYRIALRNRAGTCWYHPHPHGLSAGQIYRGLASFLIVQDEEDDRLSAALDLKLGETDLPLLLQDRRIDAQGGFVRSLDYTDLFLGYLGSHPMVNYLHSPHISMRPRIYRLRLLNASSARIFRLALLLNDSPVQFHIIGSDGGLLEQAVNAEEAFLAPGERLDVLVDLRTVPPRARLKLRSLAFDPQRDNLAQLCTTRPIQTPKTGEPAHAQATAAGGSAIAAPTPLPDGSDFDLATLHLEQGPRYTREIPGRIAHPPGLDVRAARVRSFDLDHQNMRWLINGIAFDMLKTQLSVERGSTEIWEMRNPPGGMPHPMHFHGFPFRLLERKGSPTQVRRLAVDGRGLAAAETGWKDTVLVWPGERVRLAVNFTHDYPGEQVYMLHCHNLEHEDQGMMLNVRIVPPGSASV